MSGQAVLRVAVNVPLSTVFDYLPPDGVDPSLLAPGMRVTVPFGRRRQTGLLMEIAANSALPADRLKRAIAIPDEEALLGPDELWLIRFTSEYYHHPIGEVAAAALPTLLRQGRPLAEVSQRVSLTPDGKECELTTLRRRAPKQAGILELLQQAGSLTADELDRQLPQWRRTRNALLDKGLIHIEDEVAATTAVERSDPEAGPELNTEQAAALEAMRSHDDFAVSVLDGVTGSGKTEVYLHRIQDVLAAGRQVLILVPEIG